MRFTIKVSSGDFIYLRPLSALIDGDISLFVDDDRKMDRLSQDGIITAFAKVSGMDVGIIYQDFRVNGASISKSNAQRMMAFMNTLKAEKKPLIFLMNSLGVRITQGRTIFNDAFSVIPTLFELKSEVPVITAAIGGTIGINAIYFAQGHYRLAVSTSALNLAGPEVHRRFFGDKNLSFNKFAPASHQIKVNTLVHELAETVPACLDRIKEIVSVLSTIKKPKSSFYAPGKNKNLNELLTNLGDEMIELFPAKGQDVKIFLAKFGSHQLGYILNPPARPNNLLTVASVDKTMAALDLFKTMKLPVVSIIDSPGGDPRQGESDADSMVKMTELVRQMINYPYKKMGFVRGRCFGGSGMFSFPTIFGGSRIVVVEGSQLGIMNESIIKELLENSPRLLAEWKEAHTTETADMQDMIKTGNVQKIIQKEEMTFEIKTFLLEHLIEQNQETYELYESIKLA